MAVGIGGRRIAVPAVGPRSALGVGTIREPIDLATAMRACVGAPGQLNPGVMPALVNCRLDAVGGESRVSVSLSVWSHQGQVRYSCRRLSDSQRFGVTGYVPPTQDVEYAGPVLSTGLTVGTQYELDYWLNCTPDVSGYTEGWVTTGLVWVQPDVGETVVRTIGD